ncbi:hypothetical protein HMPREF9336_00800 [Segniliparus rugosus ATCC BAA-974]|uniref:Uncharacterized protein n=1 Tax=Segniliparus rugosus (strain ATCC BAA-974 / DSM 45345 / CCUG 50838 / CIP 108380 / JCM 13579 / CDC 945) TaxID=679197 RepID=E5XMT0_SEGRC|nr:hypothetical protein HMPREF9336_00800 [Segniliparus rugosus ATCC BAA-974]
MQAAWQDGALVAAQTKRNLDHAMTTPAEQRGWFHFTGYLAYHRALIGLKALDHWGQSQAGDDHRFVHDIAYLTVKARENDGDPGLFPVFRTPILPG